jgi:hypothetical protein
MMTDSKIENIKQTDLTQSERDVLKHDAERWRRMGAGSHLDDWLAYGPGLMIRRRLAMRIAFVNRPEGKGYAQTFAALMKADGLDHMDKTSISALLWLNDEPERIQMLRELRESMTPGERSRLNSPISARKRVEQILNARHSGTEESVKVSPVAQLKEQITKQAREIAELQQKLAKRDDGLAVRSEERQGRGYRRHHRRQCHRAQGQGDRDRHRRPAQAEAEACGLV